MTRDSFHLAINTEGGEGDKTMRIPEVVPFVLKYSSTVSVKKQNKKTNGKITGTWYQSLLSDVVIIVLFFPDIDVAVVKLLV